MLQRARSTAIHAPKLPRKAAAQNTILNSQQRYGKCNCYFKPIACWPSCCVSQRTAVADFPLVLLHCTVSHFHPSTHTFTRSTRQSSPSGKASEFEFDILIPLTMHKLYPGGRSEENHFGISSEGPADSCLGGGKHSSKSFTFRCVAQSSAELSSTRFCFCFQVIISFRPQNEKRNGDAWWIVWTPVRIHCHLVEFFSKSN